MKLDHRNFIIGCIAAALVASSLTWGIAWADVANVADNTRRDVARVAACHSLPLPERTVCLTEIP